MARKPNYQFDRMERDRLKAAKKAERKSAKEARVAEKKLAEMEPEVTTAGDQDTANTPEV